MSLSFNVVGVYYIFPTTNVPPQVLGMFSTHPASHPQRLESFLIETVLKNGCAAKMVIIWWYSHIISHILWEYISFYIYIYICYLFLMKIILEKDCYLDTPIITVQLAENSQPNSSTPHRTAHLQPWHGASLAPSKFAARPDGWIRWTEHDKRPSFQWTKKQVVLVDDNCWVSPVSHDIAVSIPSIRVDSTFGD